MYVKHFCRQKTIYINLVSNNIMNSKACSIPESCSEVEVDLKRLDRMLQAAHRSSIDIKDSYDFYVLALKEFNKENIVDSYLYYDRAKYDLTSAINEAKIKIKGTRFHSLRTLSYFFKLYGLYAIIFATLSIFLFSFLIYRYNQLSILEVPLWSSFFAGLGSSAQILTGVADDLRRDGLVSRYKRLWYMAIPLLGHGLRLHGLSALQLRPDCLQCQFPERSFLHHVRLLLDGLSDQMADQQAVANVKRSLRNLHPFGLFASRYQGPFSSTAHPRRCCACCSRSAPARGPASQESPLPRRRDFWPRPIVHLAPSPGP